MPRKKDVRKTILQTLKKNKCSMYKCAYLAGINPMTLWKFLKGYTNVRIDTMAKIEQALKIITK